MVNFYALIVESGAPMGKCFCSSISVHRVHTTNDDSYVYTHLRPLAVDSIKQAQGYRFDRENQEIYISREFIPRCQWPGIQLPIVVLLHCGCLSLNPFIEFRIWNNSSSSDVLYIQASTSKSPKYESK